MNVTFTNFAGGVGLQQPRLRPRFGSPHPPQNQPLYLQPQSQPFLPLNNQTSLQATRDSDKMTQQSSGQYQPTTNFLHVSQVQQSALARNFN